MRLLRAAAWSVLMLIVVAMPLAVLAGGAGPQPCPPERPIPPESVGSIGLPFDVPIWPTLLKTEFHVLPWVTVGKASVCVPGTCWAVEFPAPCFSLKAIPVWIPWLRPLDVDCRDSKYCPPSAP
jgi:hypothetical protein